MYERIRRALIYGAHRYRVNRCSYLALALPENTLGHRNSNRLSRLRGRCVCFRRQLLLQFCYSSATVSAVPDCPATAGQTLLFPAKRQAPRAVQAPDSQESFHPTRTSCRMQHTQIYRFSFFRQIALMKTARRRMFIFEKKITCGLNLKAVNF